MYTSAFLVLAYCLLTLTIKIKNKYKTEETNQLGVKNSSPKTWLDYTTDICRLCLIASISTALIGHTESLKTIEILLLALMPLALIEHRRGLSLLRQSKTVSLYLLYCLWIVLTIWVTNTQSPHHIKFYLLIGGLSFILALLINRNDLCKKMMGYTLAIATIVTTCQRGIEFSIDPTLEPEGLVMTYKNLAAFVGILAISILLSLKPKNSLSMVSILIISLTAVSIYLTPSQAGKVSLLVIAIYIAWLFFFRLIKKNKKLAHFALWTSITAICIGSVMAVSYHKELSSALGKKETIGGRTTIWEVTYDWIKISPVLGNGGSFWLNQGGSSASNHHHEYANRGYNGFLDTLVQSGLPGLLLLVIFMISAVKETKLRNGIKILLLLSATLSLLSETHSFTGTFLIFGGATTRAILIFWLAYCLSQYRTNKELSLAKPTYLKDIQRNGI
jgi:O-antigen ligase